MTGNGKRTEDWEAVDHIEAVKPVLKSQNGEHQAVARATVYSLRMIADMRKDIKEMPDTIVEGVVMRLRTKMFRSPMAIFCTVVPTPFLIFLWGVGKSKGWW